MNWIQEVNRRGLAGPVRMALDVLEPLGPVGAQLLWVAQPVSGLVGARELIGGLAEALDEPGGVERLRDLLDE